MNDILITGMTGFLGTEIVSRIMKTTEDTVYYPLKLYLRGEMSVFPIKKSMRVNMIPVDYVADAVVRITYDNAGAGRTFHLTAPARLKRAGLDRCDQLIVGSAPVSLKLLTDFRELGIEIHNAYGLTESG